MVSTISKDEIRILFNVDNLSVSDSTAKQLFDLAVVHGQKVKRKLNYLKISLVIVRVSQRSRDYFTDVSGFGELRFPSNIVPRFAVIFNIDVANSCRKY